MEMARLRIQLQQAENRNIVLQHEAAERERIRREGEEFEAMKLRVLQLERLVADKAVADPAAVGLLCLTTRLDCLSCTLQKPLLVSQMATGLLSCTNHPTGCKVRGQIDRRMINCGVQAV